MKGLISARSQGLGAPFEVVKCSNGDQLAGRLDA